MKHNKKKITPSSGAHNIENTKSSTLAPDALAKKTAGPNNGKSAATASKMSKTRLVNLVATAVFFIAAFVLLGFDSANYLRKIELQSIFLPTSDFFAERMQLPGGLLAWTATFLTQFFHLPALGALIYTLLLICVAVLCVKAFGFSWRVYPAMLAFGAVCVLALLDMGYLIFSIKTPGWAFLLPLGLLLATACLTAYNALHHWWARMIAVIAIAVAAYALAGFYGLLAAAMCCASEAGRAISGKGKRLFALINIVVAIAAIEVVPRAWFALYHGEVPLTGMFECQLPRFYDDEGSLKTPYTLLSCALVLLALTGTLLPVKGERTRRKWLQPAAAVVALASVVSIFVFRYNDPNLRLTLDIDNAMQNQQWQQAVDIFEKADFDPTRINVMYSDMALLRQGDAPDRIFGLKIASAPYETTRALRATHDSAAPMFAFHTGMVNYAYRWAMENKVEYGLRVEQLKYMAKCAILNNEPALANKYLDNLALTLFHKPWADKYRAYVGKPAAVDKDPELAAVKKLMHPDTGFIDDNGTLEGYMWKYLATIETDRLQLMELSMLGALICRDINNFARNYSKYITRCKTIPRYFQEGILLWARLNDVTDYQQLKVDKETLDRFERFNNAYSGYGKIDLDRKRQLMGTAFADTYWYYALLNDNLQII